MDLREGTAVDHDFIWRFVSVPIAIAFLPDKDPSITVPLGTPIPRMIMDLVISEAGLLISRIRASARKLSLHDVTAGLGG